MFNFARGPDPSYPVASPDTSRVFNGTTAVFPQFAVIDTTATATVITGQVGQIIRVLAMDLVVSAALVIRWQSSGGPTDISGPQSFAANGGIVRTFNQVGWFQTLPGESLVINVSGSGTVGGNLTYILF